MRGIYFQYQPSCHHLHVHFTHIRFDAPGSDVMWAHLLSDVIDNISIAPDYYQRKTLSYCVRDGDALYLKFKEHENFSWIIALCCFNKFIILIKNMRGHNSPSCRL